VDVIAHLTWRVYPAGAVLALGVVVALSGLRRCRASWRRPLTEPMKPLLWMRGFRRTILGLALMGVGAAWIWHIGWLLAVALVIGFEETIESSIAVYAMDLEQDLVKPAAAPSALPRP
jgi:hypothetical protein